jgi:hypothetical protein
MWNEGYRQTHIMDPTHKRRIKGKWAETMVCSWVAKRFPELMHYGSNLTYRFVGELDIVFVSCVTGDVYVFEIRSRYASQDRESEPGNGSSEFPILSKTKLRRLKRAIECLRFTFNNDSQGTYTRNGSRETLCHHRYLPHNSQDHSPQYHDGVRGLSCQDQVPQVRHVDHCQQVTCEPTIGSAHVLGRRAQGERSRRGQEERVFRLILLEMYVTGTNSVSSGARAPVRVKMKTSPICIL